MGSWTQVFKNQVSKLTRELWIAKEQYSEEIRRPFRLQDIQTDERMNFYTGVRRIDGFYKLVSVMKPKLSKIRYWNGPRTVCNPLRHKYVTKKRGPKRCLSCENELLLTLMKVRLGLLIQDLVQLFGISVQQVSNIFITGIKALAKTVGSLIFNPAGSSPQCATIFLPTMFACWHSHLYMWRHTIRMNEAWRIQ